MVVESTAEVKAVIKLEESITKVKAVIKLEAIIDL
jgi:hypothetical protein